MTHYLCLTQPVWKETGSLLRSLRWSDYTIISPQLRYLSFFRENNLEGPKVDVA